MGEADDPDLSSRIRTWAKRAVPGRSNDTRASLPTHEHSRSGIANTDPEKIAQNGPQDGPATVVGGPEGHLVVGHNPTTAVHHEYKSETRPGLATPHTTSSSDTKVEGASDTPVTPAVKPPAMQRMGAGIVRFGRHAKKAITHSWLNLLLVFVPAGIAVEVTGQSPSIVFAINAVAIVPLAGLLVYATESVARRLGDTLGALLNVSFGNAVELIIFVIALTRGEIRIVQASLLGSILSNLLLIMGMAFLCGGLRYQEQLYNNTITQISACLLSLSVSSLLLPTAFHASFSDSVLADETTLKISRATSVILLIIYILYLLFQLKSHAYLYESTPQHIVDEESHPGPLTDLFETSSSSGSSSDSSSSDTDTSGSHTTTKRIRRAFRNRRRRKSSASSTNTTSVPSIVSSPSFERTPIVNDPSLTFGPSSRRPSALATLNSGDEADVEHAGRRSGQPRIRDFVDSLHDDVVRDRTSKKKRKHRKKHKKHQLERKVPEETVPTHKEGKKPAQDENLALPTLVNTNDMAQMGELGLTQSAPRKGLVWDRSIRPALPKMLTQNVFVTQPPTLGKPTGPSPAPVRTDGQQQLRRTNSLPDRLNRRDRAKSPNPRLVAIYPHSHPAVQASKKDDEDEDEEVMSRTASTVLLLISTGLVAVCAEFLVNAIPGMIDASPISQEFVGLIILPVVSNAAEHFTAVTVAAKNKMDLSIGVSVGSSIQIALFVTPFIVLLGWWIGQPMTLFFNLFETLSIFVTAFVVNFLVLDGRSNYLEGSLLCAAYIIIAVAAFYYPDSEAQSTLVGGVSR